MIKIGTAALKNAVAIAGNAVDRSATIPILGHLLCTLDADEQILRLTGTNMEQTVTATSASDDASIQRCRCFVLR